MTSITSAEYTLLTKNGYEFPAELSAGVIMDLSGKPVSYVSLAKDISAQKRAEEDMKKRMMKFKLDEGKFYLAKESYPALSLEAFKDLLKVGYYGLIISRMPEIEFRKIRFKKMKLRFTSIRLLNKTIRDHIIFE
ncbi:MAG: PAS domain S-box protein [Promethearchaeota archaeon]